MNLSPKPPYRPALDWSKVITLVLVQFGPGPYDQESLEEYLIYQLEDCTVDEIVEVVNYFMELN